MFHNSFFTRDASWRGCAVRLIGLVCGRYVWLQDRWVLLQHHHWLLKQVQEDGRVEAVTNFNTFGMQQQTMLEGT